MRKLFVACFCFLLSTVAAGATDYLTSETPARVISDSNGFVLNETGYPPGWLLTSTQPQRTMLGIRTITYTGAPADIKYYTNALAAAVISGDSATLAWVNTPLSLAAVKVQKLIDLGAYAVIRDAAGTAFGGFTVSTSDRFKIIYAVSNQRAIAGAQSSFSLPDAVGVYHTLSSAQMQSLYTAVAVYVNAVLANQNVHSTAISALVSAATVIAYDYTTGWP